MEIVTNIYKKCLFTFFLISLGFITFGADSLKITPSSPVREDVVVNGTSEAQAKTILNGASAVALSPNLSVYPNPCHEYVYIDFLNLDGKQEVRIQIIDICGQVVYDKLYESDFPESVRLKIGLSEIQRGIYFVKASQGSHEVTKKIVVK